jgi:hypothetical protein
VDDIDAAISEIIAQLDFDGKNHLLKNTIGIVSCYAEYVESGVWAALAKALPFEILGTTTIAALSSGEVGETMLSILVLTSDDVFFSTALSEPITDESAEPLKALFNDASAKLPGTPSFMLSFLALFSKLSTQFYVDCMSEISGGVPNFGTVTVDHNSDYHASYVLSNGEYYKDRFAILLFHGNISPSFYVGNISDEKIFSEKGIVTKADGNILQVINGKPAVDFLLSLGLSKTDNGEIEGLNSFPLMVDFNDGTMPITGSMLNVTPEGYIFCVDKVPEGSIISIGYFDPDEIVTTTIRTLKQSLAKKEHHTMLMYSCVGRYFALGYDSLKELEQVKKEMDGLEFNYMTAYSGGEICPVYDKEGEPVNRNHGNSFIICTF